MSRRVLTQDDRVAIGELVMLATELCAQSTCEAVRAIGAICVERAANIWRGEIRPYVFSDEQVRAFEEGWDPKRRARFNPKRSTRSST